MSFVICSSFSDALNTLPRRQTRSFVQLYGLIPVGQPNAVLGIDRTIHPSRAVENGYSLRIFNTSAKYFGNMRGTGALSMTVFSVQGVGLSRWYLETFPDRPSALNSLHPSFRILQSNQLWQCHPQISKDLHQQRPIDGPKLPGLKAPKTPRSLEAAAHGGLVPGPRARRIAVSLAESLHLGKSTRSL